LSEAEQKLYDLIVRRFLAHFYPPATYKIHTVLTLVEQESFKSTIKEQLSLGWKKVYADSTGKRSKSKTNSVEEDVDNELEEWTDTPFSIQSELEVGCTEAEVK